MKIKRIFKKLILIIIISITIFPNFVFAANNDEESSWGILFEPMLLIVTGLGDGLLNIVQSSMLPGSPKAVHSDFMASDVDLNVIYGPYTILSDRVPMLCADFVTHQGGIYDSNYAYTSGMQSSTSNSKYNYPLASGVNIQTTREDANKLYLGIKQNIQKWYVAVRNLTVSLLLVVLVYMGIRIVLSATGEDTAKYKKMLQDWFTALALIFTMHIIMTLIIVVVNMFTDMIVGANQNAYADPLVVEVRQEIATLQGKNIRFGRFGYVMLYIILIGMTILFTMKFLRRTLYIGFLTIIAPLVTLTYPIDKVKDGKSQAFNNWFKEYLFNFLIQPIDLLIYTILVSSAIEFAKVNIIYAIGAMMFIMPAEKFIQSLFGIEIKHGATQANALIALAMTDKLVKTLTGGVKGSAAKKSKDAAVKKKAADQLSKIKWPGNGPNQPAGPNQNGNQQQNNNPNQNPDPNQNQNQSKKKTAGKRVIKGAAKVGGKLLGAGVKLTAIGAGAMLGFGLSAASGDMTKAMTGAAATAAIAQTGINYASATVKKGQANRAYKKQIAEKTDALKQRLNGGSNP